MVYLNCRELGVTKVRKFEITGLSKPVENEAAARFLFMRTPFININRTICAILAFAVGLLLFENAWAAFTLSATPYEGGYELRFGRLNAELSEVKKELSIRVTSDQNQQYRVYQELITPLTNAQGYTVPNTDFTFYTLQGSNATGTLAAGQIQPVRANRMLLYTSNSQGPTDSFTLIYGLSLPAGLPSGSYRGRIKFSLEATDGSLTPQSVFLNITATLESSASLEMITPLGGKTIELKLDELAQEKNEVLFKVRGNLGQTYRLIQSLEEHLYSDREELPTGSIIFKVTEGRKGMVAGQDEVSFGETVLYTSNVHGEADDILVTYHLQQQPLSETKAGVYRGRMHFFIETQIPVTFEQIAQPILSFLVTIEPTFEIQVTPETGGRIEFKGLKPNLPPRINEVVIEVSTNMGRPYQVSQRVENLLTNKEGATIPQEHFVFYEEKITEAGVLKQPSRIPVRFGETTLFVSDPEGSPAQFKIIYELTIPRDLTAGNYGSRITYAISEL